MPLPFQPRDPDFERRVRASFDRQAAMRTRGVTLERVAPGEVDLALPFSDALTQQHGFLGLGRVLRSGRTLTVVSGELRAENGGVFALQNGTMMTVRGRPELAD